MTTNPTQFTFDGNTYDFMKRPTLGEMAAAERALGVDGNDFTQMENVLVGYWLAIRRGQLGRGVRGPDLITIEEVASRNIGEFMDVELPSAPVAQDETEPPESEWPLDPTDAGAGTDKSSGSGQHGSGSTPIFDVTTSEISATNSSGPFLT